MNIEERPWVVLKFGGTSVATAGRWNVICSRVKDLLTEKKKVWVVISAVTKVTNALEASIHEAVTGADHLSSFKKIVEIHADLAVAAGVLGLESRQTFVELCMRTDEPAPSSDSSRVQDLNQVVETFQDLRRLLEGIRLTCEASPRINARILSHGELLSTALGSLIMRVNGIDVAFVDARNLLHSEVMLGRPTEDVYLEAVVRPRKDLEAAEREAGGKSVVLTQGFIASPSARPGRYTGKQVVETCVLGRGGSDTSGALFAALLGAARYEVWTDVHGLFTSDPRQVPMARLIKAIGYREAQELAAMGAKVLHPRCIGPAQWAGVPIQIRNTNDPFGETTDIHQEEDNNGTLVLAVAQRKNMTLLTVTSYDMWGHAGYLSNFFKPFEQLGISVDLIATSQYSVSVTLDHIPGGCEGDQFRQLVESLSSLGDVKARHHCAVVSIVGRKLRTALHEFGSSGVLETLQGKEVLLLTESTEDLNMSFVVDQAESDKIVRAMHDRLFPHGEDAFNGLSGTHRDHLLGSTWQELRKTRKASQ